jgi:hypothetical protein
MTLPPAPIPLIPTPTPAEAVMAGRALAHSINNRLSLPLGVLELLEGQADIPDASRSLIAAARAQLAQLALEVQEFQSLMARTA